MRDQPTRSANEQPLLAREPARHRERLSIGDRAIVIDDRHVDRSRNLVLPDALDLVRHTLRLPRALAPPVLGQYRSDRIAADDFHVGILLLQKFPDARDRAARARGGDEVRDPSFGLLPQLGARRLVVRFRICGIVELVREHRVRRLLRYPRGHHHVVIGMIGRHGRRRDDHLGAKGLEQPHFLLRHLVGHREDAAIALERRRHREPHTRVAARSLDNRAARLQLPRLLGALDDRHADPILHAPARVEELCLRVHRRDHAARHSAQPNEWRPADGVENAVVRACVAREGAHGTDLGRSGWRMVSPASGFPFGWRKNTGSLSDTLTGCPFVVAGSKRSSRDPATADESSPG